MAQDTTWVQTFTFDTISTRRADFPFPQELNTMRFEKVLMYYKLKCSPLTPWDQYNCGEWDYLAYTRIFDHTGTYDSVQIDGAHYMNNYVYTPIYDYEPWGYSYNDNYQITEHDRTGSSTIINSLGMTPTGSAFYPFDLNQKGARFQMLVTEAELTAAGITAGDIQSLAVYLSNITNGGELMHPRVSIKSTTDTQITAFH
jgi:hypothetical protein